MRSRYIYIGAVLMLIMAAMGSSMVSRTDRTQRYMQHQKGMPEAERPEADFVTHLPIISIQTSEAIPEETAPEHGMPESYASCEVAIYDSEDQWNTLEDAVRAQAEGLIRIRGNTSRKFDKKSYLLKFGTQEKKKDISVMGMNPSDKWVLHGPFLDRTLLRNYLCYNVAGQIMEYAPQTRYCEMFINGEYQGLYLAVEAVSVEEGRLELSTTGKKNPVTSWLVRWDRDDKSDNKVDNFVYYTYKGGVSSLDLLYPGKDTCTPEKKSYVESEISAIERSLYMRGSGDRLKGYSRYIDIAEFARYFVINEFFENMDAGRFSTYYYKDVRGKVKPVVWDFNNGSDNYIYFSTDENGFDMVQSPWFGEMLRDELFVDEVIYQYRALRKDILSDENLNRMIDETIAYLGDAVDRNYDKYGYVFLLEQVDDINYLSPVERNYTSYEESVQQLKDQIRDRGRWMDRNIETLLQYCRESKNALKRNY